MALVLCGGSFCCRAGDQGQGAGPSVSPGVLKKDFLLFPPLQVPPIGGQMGDALKRSVAVCVKGARGPKGK